jgi:hypothetical protein
MAKPSKHKPKAGAAKRGQTFDPRRMAEERPGREPVHQAAPSPGLPISEQRYDSLKRAAKKATRRSTKSGQEDPSGKG